MSYRVLVDLVAALFGLVIGSHLNVIVHRLPRGISTVLPRSACPWCGGAIAARDNLPLVSFLLLRGRCRRCAGPISWRYPLLELFTALLFVACIERFGLSGRALVSAVFGCLLLTLAAIDAERLELPDRLTLPAIPLGLACQAWLEPTLLEAVIGVFLGAGLLILLMNYWFWLRGEEGMGIGDVNMLAMIGAFLGWKGVLVTLALGAGAGSVFGLASIAAGRLGRRSHLPFGTFLALGALAALFAGDWLAAAYGRFL